MHRSSAVLLVRAVIVVAYHDAFSARFVLDDCHYVLENAASAKGTPPVRHAPVRAR